MEVGYNLVTKKAIEEGKYKLLNEKPISVIEFLRGIRKRSLPKKATILGLELLLYYCKEEDRENLASYVRKILSGIAAIVLQNGNIFQFVVEESISLNKNFVLNYEKMKLNLNWIFGNRIQAMNTLLDWLYVPPNI